MSPSAETLSRLAAVVGEKYAIRDPRDMAAYMTEWREIWTGRSPLVLRPQSTAEISQIMAIADETRTAIVPQSGNTGLVGGQIPDESGNEVVLSLDRLTGVIDVDAANNTMTLEAGVTLKAAQDAAEAQGRLFPLSLASEGSCRIGGNLSTNAGGLNVLAYGSARELCLGLEVVLADGRVWNGLKRLRKDNTGYDLKNIFVGAEGTLGIITAAVLKLYPRPRRYDTAFAAVPSARAAIELLSLAKEMSGNRLVAFELIPAFAMDITVKHMGVRNPLTETSPWYVLSEAADLAEDGFAAIFTAAMERGLVSDVVIAQSLAQRSEMWTIRELMPESQKHEGGSIKNDISVPVSRIPEFLEDADRAVRQLLPGCRIMGYGHAGDGNIHYNISQPVGYDKQAFLARRDDFNDVVYDVVLRYGGSISAEHGIGRLKRHRMGAIKSAVELDLMRSLKRMLDPHNILNPGKVLPD